MQHSHSLMVLICFAGLLAFYFLIRSITRIHTAATRKRAEANVRDMLDAFPESFKKTAQLSADFQSDLCVDSYIEWAEGCYLNACHYFKIGETKRALKAITGANESLAIVADRAAKLRLDQDLRPALHEDTPAS